MEAMACMIFALTLAVLGWFAFGCRRRLWGILAALGSLAAETGCGYFYPDMLRNSGKPTYLLGWSFQPAVPVLLGVLALTSIACVLVCAAKRKRLEY